MTPAVVRPATDYLVYRDLGAVAVANMFSGMQAIVNGAINLGKALPEVAIATAGAVGEFDPGLSKRNESPAAPEASDTNSQPPPLKYPDAGDLGYEKALQMYELTCSLCDLLGEEVVYKLQSDEIRDISECYAQFSS